MISSRGIAANATPPKARNVVLVHGLFADGSSWSEVIARLQAAGLNATAVQNPLTTLPEAVASAEPVVHSGGHKSPTANCGNPCFAGFLELSREGGRESLPLRHLTATCENPVKQGPPRATGFGGGDPRRRTVGSLRFVSNCHHSTARGSANPWINPFWNA
jgi:hypothetical protein